MGILIAEALGPLVGGGIWYTQLIEPPCDSRLAGAREEPGEHIPDHLGGVLIDDKGVFVLPVFGIAVGGKRPDELPILPLVLEGPPHVCARLIGVLLIHEPGDTDL